MRPVSAPGSRHVIDLLHVILLGIIEGVTEFLPISSTGHLLIAEKFWLGARSDLFNIGIQAGAILAVTLIYWRRIGQLLTQWREPANRDYLLKLIVAFAITAVLGFIAVKLGFKLPETVTPIAWALVIGGFWMIGAELLAARQPERREVTWRVAILVGIATMYAATGYELLKVWKDGGAAHEDWSALIIGFAVSLVVAFIAVKWLLGYIRTHTFTPFAIYRIVFGVALLLLVPTGA